MSTYNVKSQDLVVDCQIQPVSVCIKKRFFFAPKRLFFAPKLTRSPSFRHFPPLLGTQIIVTKFHPFPTFGEYFLPKQHLRKAKSENSFTIFYNLIEKRINGNSRPFTVIRVEEKKRPVIHGGEPDAKGLRNINAS